MPRHRSKKKSVNGSELAAADPVKSVDESSKSKAQAEPVEDAKKDATNREIAGIYLERDRMIASGAETILNYARKDAQKAKNRDAFVFAQITGERERLARLKEQVRGRLADKGTGSEWGVVEAKAQEINDMIDGYLVQYNEIEALAKHNAAEGEAAALREETKNLRERRNAVEKKMTLAAYKPLRNKYDYLKELEDNLPEDDAAEYQDKKVNQKALSEELDHERKRLNYYKNRFSDADKEALKQEEGAVRAVEDRLSQTYGKDHPVTLMVRKAALLKGKRKMRAESTDSEKVKEKLSQAGEMQEGVSEIAENLSGAIEKGTGFNPISWLEDHKAEAGAWLSGKLGISHIVSKVEEAKEMAAGIAEVLAPLVNIGKILYGIYKLVKDRKTKTMSAADLKGRIQELTVGGVNALLDTVNMVCQLIKPIPIVGSVVGFAKSGIVVVTQALEIAENRDNKKVMEQEKENQKLAMVKKRYKYGQDADLKDLDLFGFMGITEKKRGIRGNRAEASAHVAKESSKEGWRKKYLDAGNTTVEAQAALLGGKVNESGTNIYEQMQALKDKKNRGDLTRDEKRLYYQMKTQGMIRQYQEGKESVKKSDSRMRSAWENIGFEAADIVAGICDFIPGVGTVISEGIKFATTLTKGLTSGTKKLVHGIREFTGDKKMVEKKARREALASDVYNRMLYVSGYMKDEADVGADGKRFMLTKSSAPRVEKTLTYVDKLTNSLGYSLMKTMELEDMDSMIDMMSTAFSAKG